MRANLLSTFLMGHSKHFTSVTKCSTSKEPNNVQYGFYVVSRSTFPVLPLTRSTTSTASALLCQVSKPKPTFSEFSMSFNADSLSATPCGLEISQPVQYNPTSTNLLEEKETSVVTIKINPSERPLRNRQKF